MGIDLEPEQQRALLGQAADLVVEHGRSVRSLRVAPDVDPEEVRRHVAGFDLERGGDAGTVVAAVAGLLESATVLTTHPRYFGLFNPSPLALGVAADLLTAGFNPQLAVWSHAPAAVEIEARVVREVGGWLGLPDACGSFTTGGAEANATGVLLALQRAFPQVATDGVRVLPGRPLLYASSESHLAWLKIAQQCGLGRGSVRFVPVDGSARLDLAELRRMLAADRAAGGLPFLLVATAGTTSAGVVDPLEDAAALAQHEGLWLHVDAAWAGAAALSAALRPHLRGIERADSVTVDAHKWLSVPMGAGMLLTRHGGRLAEVFDVATAYMPDAVEGTAPDPYRTSMQWSRRAAGLKLFLTLAVHGRSGYAEQLDRDVRLGRRLREAVRGDGWQVLNDTPLPVVCLADPAHAGDGAFHEAVAAAVVSSGAAWVSAVRVAGRPAVRACIISHRTTEDDVDALVSALGETRAALAPRRRLTPDARDPHRPSPSHGDG